MRRRALWPRYVLGASLVVAAVLGASPAQGAPGRGGLTAYSAYGLQVSVPGTWWFEPFAGCPGERAPGTLVIGSTGLSYSCPLVLADANFVSMVPGPASACTGRGATVRTVNGVRVVERGHVWQVCGRPVVLDAGGPQGLAALATLRRATTAARPAPGRLTGGPVLASGNPAPLEQVHLVSAHGESVTVDSVFGDWSVTVAPGRYRVTVHGGGTTCTPVRATVVSGVVTTAPALRCSPA